MTIRRKLVLLYSGILAFVILFFGVAVFSVIRKTWIDTTDERLGDIATQVISFSNAYRIREFGTQAKIGIDLPPLDIFQSSGIFVQVWQKQPDGSMQFIAASENLENFDNPLDPQTVGAAEDQFMDVRLDNTTELRVLTKPIRLLGNEQLIGNVQVAASLGTINEATSKLALVMLVGGGGAVLASFLIGMWLSEQTMKPIEAIIEAAEGISTAKDLQKRLPWHGPDDELGRLVDVFNRLMNRIEHLFGVQRRLVADVSHELRTPLTAIRGNLDLIKRYGMDPESLEAIESETSRMARMVSDLLLLARADYGSMQLEMAQIDLDTVVTEVFKEARVLAKDRELDVKLAHLEPVRMMGNTDRLKQLLLNLVSNAIKFTPDGGEILLSLRQAGEMAHLTVSDTGVGIAQEDLERIFDRFYQADPARSKIQSGDGAGLGLAIAKMIAESHGGTIEASSIPNKGTIFTVTLRAFAQVGEMDDADEDESPNGRYRPLQRLRRRATETTE